MAVPYIGFSNDTLSKQPRVQPGDLISCPQCKGQHPLESGDKGETIMLLYRCGGKTYLGAIDGRLTIGVKADCSGEVDA